MSLELPFGIKTINPLPVDSKYLNNNVPYTGTTEVNTLIPAGIRHVGLTVLVESGTTNVEYWYQTGTTNSDLILKTNTSTGTLTGATNGLSISGKNVVLGGTLTGNTTIETNGSSFTVGNAIALTGTSYANSIVSNKLVSWNGNIEMGHPQASGSIRNITTDSVSGVAQLHFAVAGGTAVLYDKDAGGQAQLSIGGQGATLNLLHDSVNGSLIIGQGNPFTIQSNDGSGGAGGNTILIRGGDGSTNGSGGDLEIRAGNAAGSGTDGNIIINSLDGNIVVTQTLDAGATGDTVLVRDSSTGIIKEVPQSLAITAVTHGLTYIPSQKRLIWGTDELLEPVVVNGAISGTCGIQFGGTRPIKFVKHRVSDDVSFCFNSDIIRKQINLSDSDGYSFKYTEGRRFEMKDNGVGITGNTIAIVSTGTTTINSLGDIILTQALNAGATGDTVLVRDSSGVVKGVSQSSIGGGGGSSVTVNNGLTKTGDNIYLGGTLTGDTVIETTGSSFTVGNAIALTGTSYANSIVSNKLVSWNGNVELGHPQASGTQRKITTDSSSGVAQLHLEVAGGTAVLFDKDSGGEAQFSIGGLGAALNLTHTLNNGSKISGKSNASPFIIQSNDGSGGAAGGSILVRGGDGDTNGNGGGLEIRSGNAAGSGTDGDITINSLDGNIVLTQTLDAGATGDTVLVREASTGIVKAVSQSSLGGGGGASSQTIYVSSSAIYPRITSGCTYLQKIEFATSFANVQVLEFDQTLQQYAQFTTSFPSNWNAGTVTATVYWSATGGTGDVVWEINGGAYSNDDALTTALGTAQSVTDTFIAANDVHITSSTSAITLAGSPAVDDLLAFQITRNSPSGSDTLTAKARLMGIKFTLTNS